MVASLLALICARTLGLEMSVAIAFLTLCENYHIGRTTRIKNARAKQLCS